MVEHYFVDCTVDEMVTAVGNLHLPAGRLLINLRRPHATPGLAVKLNQHDTFDTRPLLYWVPPRYIHSLN